MTGSVVAVSLSSAKGVRKTPQQSVKLLPGYGIEGDAHAGDWHRQVSLLAVESIDKMRRLGLSVGPGDFAENIATQGVELPTLPPGTRLIMGDAVVSITQIGKECHARCAIYHQAGDCVMPREGIFAEVLRGGMVTPGTPIVVWPRFRALVVTLSDRCSRGERQDESGRALCEELTLLGVDVAYKLIPDNFEELSTVLASSCDTYAFELILTTGGTGLSPRDITPEATMSCIDREVPGLAEAMRMQSLKVTPMAMLSRAVAGIRKKTLIINLPGSTKGALECLGVIKPVLPHALEVMSGVTLSCGQPVN